MLTINKTLKTVVPFDDFFHLFYITHFVIVVKEASYDRTKFLIKVCCDILLNISNETYCLFALSDDAI